MNFNSDQTFHILNKLGYEGPKTKDMMLKFIQATPRASSTLGKLSEAGKIKMNTGGLVTAYNETLGRDPDEEGLSYYTQQLDSGRTIDDIKLELSSSPEAQFNPVYQQFLGRGADAAGASHYVDQLASGRTMEDITSEISNSEEAKAYNEANKVDSAKSQELVSSAKSEVARLQQVALDAANKLKANPSDPTLQANAQTATNNLSTAQQKLTEAQSVDATVAPGGQEIFRQAYDNPSSLVTQTNVEKIAQDDSQILDPNLGKIQGEVPTVSGQPQAATLTASGADTFDPVSIDPTKASPSITDAVSNFQAAQGSSVTGVSAATMDPTQSARFNLEAAQITGGAPSAGAGGGVSVTDDMQAQAAGLDATAVKSEAQTLDKTYNPSFVTGDIPPGGFVEAQDTFNMTPTEIANLQATAVKDAAKASEIPTVEAATSRYESTVTAAQGSVGANELANASDIVGTMEAVNTVAATMQEVDTNARVVAEQGTLGQTSLAIAAQGVVGPQATVQKQIEGLLNQFNNGTPAWAAGAMRAATAAMSSRGLGASSMAGAAIVQAAMESALPIAQSDANTFAAMELTNLNNRQQVALANAAASTNMELANLNNRQQAALQNSAQSFDLQSQNLSNQQAVVLANAQLKAAFQEQVLNVNTQTALSNAAVYAERANLNLTFSQQANLQRSAENLQVEMTNLSNTQQSALANLQVRASLIGQELSNEQQMAVLDSTQIFEAARFNASAEQQAFLQDASTRAALEGKAMDARQQTALFNASAILDMNKINLNNEQQAVIQTTALNAQLDVQNLSNKQQTALANASIEAALQSQVLSNQQQANIANAAAVLEIAGLNLNASTQASIANANITKDIAVANLSAKSAKTLADAAHISNLELTNLNNRQQAQIENARNLLTMDIKNLDNTQQTEMFKQSAIVSSIMTDTAAENAAKQFNASSQAQTDQFFAGMQERINTFNTNQQNTMQMEREDRDLAAAQFDANIKNARQQFETTNGLVIAQANATWRQNIATIDTAAQNEANFEEAKNANGLTAAAMDQLWQNERDLMSFAWQSSESQADRDFQTLMADKEIDASEDASNKQALGYLAGKFLFGDSGFSLGGLLG